MTRRNFLIATPLLIIAAIESEPQIEWQCDLLDHAGTTLNKKRLHGRLRVTDETIYFETWKADKICHPIGLRIFKDGKYLTTVLLTEQAHLIPGSLVSFCVDKQDLYLNID